MKTIYEVEFNEEYEIIDMLYVASSPSFYGPKVIDLTVIRLVFAVDVNVLPFKVELSVTSRLTPEN